jgi:hypothetical protein
MNKFIYKIDFDAIKTGDSIQYDTVEVNEELNDDESGDLIKVISIEQVYTFGIRTFIIHYSNGKEYEITDMYHVHKKLIVN